MTASVHTVIQPRYRIVDGLTSHRIVRAIDAAMKEDIVAELTAAG